MSHVTIEIKARCADREKVRNILRGRGAEFRGLDHQIDTYFKVPAGRLKLREGNIENFLIFYERPDTQGPKQSDVTLYAFDPASSLKEILLKLFEILVIVDKKREIFFIDNIKFHLDDVAGLGTFVEIEAMDAEGTIGTEKLRRQCDMYIGLLGIKEKDLYAVSYSDLLLGGR